MASIYDPTTGEAYAEGLQGSNVCDAAWIMAKQTAAALLLDVHLVDDDGEWIIHPDGSRAAHTPAPQDDYDD